MGVEVFGITMKFTESGVYELVKKVLAGFSQFQRVFRRGHLARRDRARSPTRLGCRELSAILQLG